MLKRMQFFLACLLILPSLVFARPVSYPSGWTSMIFDDRIKTTAHLHYTPTRQYSVGFKYEDWKRKKYSSQFIQINRLLERWNKTDSQANLYFLSGIGISTNDEQAASSSNKLSGFAGFSADWENRRYFIAYANRYNQPQVIDEFFHQSVRLGWAPYIGDYGDLHTWLMYKITHRSELDDKLLNTIILRLFKGVHLVEAGYNDEHEFSLNYVIRY